MLIWSFQIHTFFAMKMNIILRSYELYISQFIVFRPFFHLIFYKIDYFLEKMVICILLFVEYSK